MYIINDDCDRCGYCLIECALEAIEKGHKKHTILQDKCTRCGACYEVCPIQAIVITDEPAPG